MADNQSLPPDPIRTTSLSGPIFVSTALLLAATGWAIFDESVTKRPYLEYQSRWVKAFRDFLDLRIMETEGRENQIKASDEYKRLDAEYKAVAARQAPEIKAVSDQLVALTPYFGAVGFTFRDKKGKIDEYVNRIENASASAKEDLIADLNAFKTKKFKIEVPGADGKFETREIDAASLIDEFIAKKADQGRLQGALGRASQPVQVAKKAVDEYFAKQLKGLSSAQLDGLHTELSTFVKEIKQIHVKEIDLVDRCESCHLGVLKPTTIRASDVGGEKAFVSHPNRDLLAIHDPERFGCSLCHGGNGVGVTSVAKGHGLYKHWLWPLHDRENFEAGCVSCHRNDIALDHGKTVSRGKEIFRGRGCWGCHKYEGFDTEQEQLAAIRKDLGDLAAKEEDAKNRMTAIADAVTANLAAQKKADDRIENRQDLDDDAKEAEKARSKAAFAAERAALNASKEGLSQKIAQYDGERDGKRKRQVELYQEVKKVGPNLKEIRHKIKPEWIPDWIRTPEAFRPETKMPSFGYLTDDQLKSISAFIWNRALDPKVVPLAKSERGDARSGKRLFESRGCTACHAVTDGDVRVGNNWAADLSRVGEKANFDYVVHWVQHPKTRLAPYSIDRKRDLLPADFQAKGLPYSWPLEGGVDPETGGPLVAHNFTAMPSLRLSDQDAKDIATYLVSLKTDKDYADVGWMTDASPELLRKGEMWTKHFGCAGCHEIPGLEDEQRIGVELTVEGSKPMERLDFGLLTHDAKHPKHHRDPAEREEQRKNHPYPPEDPEADIPAWYEHKGFFMNKLKNPQVFDLGKYRSVEDTAALKMPNFRLSYDDRVAMTTFLLGSTDPNAQLKEAGYYHAPDGGPAKAIQDGWWVIKKYNCQGCHSIAPGDLPSLWTQKSFTSAAPTARVTAADGEVFFGGEERRPPTLVGQGSRTDPQWLADFLRNPALSKSSTHRNGVRSYLNVRMPTFHMSENEIQKLVAFFAALAGEPAVYIRPDAKPLTDDELATVREYFANCARCHAKDDKPDPSVTAPNFQLTPSRLNPAWVARWLQMPQSMAPGTKMPNWFVERADGAWKFADKTGSARMDAYQGDHVQLLMRYLARYNEYEGKK